MKKILTDALVLGVLLHNVEHVEEGDEGVVGDLLDEELEGVAIERNALESVEDGVEDGATSDWKAMSEGEMGVQLAASLTVANATDVLVRKHEVLVEIRKATRLFDESRWQAECVRTVVGELGVNEVMNLVKDDLVLCSAR